MSPNILLQIEKTIQENGLLNADETVKFIRLLKDFKKGEILNPGAVMRHMKLTTEKSYKLFEALKSIGTLSENFELYCHECSKYHHKLYEYYADIPEYEECEGCFEKLTRPANVIVVYKVINDGE